MSILRTKTQFILLGDAMTAATTGIIAGGWPLSNAGKLSPIVGTEFSRSDDVLTAVIDHSDFRTQT